MPFSMTSVLSLAAGVSVRTLSSEGGEDRGRIETPTVKDWTRYVGETFICYTILQPI